MVLELGSILTDYVRQLSFPCISHFPGHGSHSCPGPFNRSPLGIQYPKLVCTLRKFQEGRRVTGPFCWACAQGQYGPGTLVPYNSILNNQIFFFFFCFIVNVDKQKYFFFLIVIVDINRISFLCVHWNLFLKNLIYFSLSSIIFHGKKVMIDKWMIRIEISQPLV